MNQGLGFGFKRFDVSATGQIYLPPTIQKVERLAPKASGSPKCMRN